MKGQQSTLGPENTPDGYLWLGQVGRPHGVRGAFFLKTQDNRSDWAGYRQVLLRSGKEEKLILVEKSYLSGGKLALQLEGINNRELCESLYNAELFVARAEIRTTEDEYVVADIVGCAVEVEGRAGLFGTVVAVHNFGAQETLEIKKNDSDDTIYYPFIEPFVSEVNQAVKKITIKDEPAFLDGQIE